MKVEPKLLNSGSAKAIRPTQAEIYKQARNIVSTIAIYEVDIDNKS